MFTSTKTIILTLASQVLLTKANLQNTTLTEDVAETVGYELLPLYIIGVVYCFIALAIVCDEYFVPALEIMADKWHLAPNVAGATLMAAGGSAPELFTSFIGTFQRSSVGFSTIVGSAVFNVLFVIGACVLFQRETLQLTSWPLMRDCSFYTISLAVLSIFFSVISPDVIEWWEATILFAMYLLYVYIMKNNDRLHECAIANKWVTADKKTSEVQEPVTFRAGLIKLLIDTANFQEAVSILVVTKVVGDIEETFKKIDKDGNGTIDRQELAELVNSLGYTRDTSQLDQLFGVLDVNGDGEISKSEFEEWYLRSETRMENDARRIYDSVAKLSDGDYISQDDVTTLLTHLGMTNTQDDKSDFTNIEAELGIEGGNITYPQFLEWYRNSLFWRQQHLQNKSSAEAAEGVDISFPTEGIWNRLVWFATIPILLSFYVTIPDVKRPKMSRWKYITFLISIVWIGIISYFMVNWAEDIGAQLGIPINVMGLTILAAGTSVPDLISSVIVARQGEGDMAISSSIGSNIFDILVGLPLPWMAFSAYHSTSVDVVADNLAISLPILIAMLVIVVASIHLCGWMTKKPLAYMMFIFYAIFVGQDLARSDW